jgi:hypothetical protein
LSRCDTAGVASPSCVLSASSADRLHPRRVLLIHATSTDRSSRQAQSRRESIRRLCASRS